MKTMIFFPLFTHVKHSINKYLILGIACSILFASCKDSSTDPEIDNNIAKKIIGSEGGILESNDGFLKLNIPSNAIDNEIEFSINLDEIANGRLNAQEQDTIMVTEWYKLEPNDITFSKQIEISIQYDLNQVGEDNINKLVPLYLSDNHDEFGYIEFYEHDSLNTQLKIKSDHFSSYSIAQTTEDLVFNFKWDVDTIYYFIEEDKQGYLWGYTQYASQEEMIKLVEEAVESWEEHQSTFEIKRTNSINNANIILNTKNSVFLAHARANLPWNGLKRMTLTDNDQITIDFESSSDVFNGYYTYDHRTGLKNIIVHEVGHSLGLKHNSQESSVRVPKNRPIMWVAGFSFDPNLAFKEFERQISGDDISALQYLYGENEDTFKECGDILTDIDGNEYETVQIGEQCWMAENLKTSFYRNGTEILNVTEDNEWRDLSTGAWAYYDNNESNNEVYGKLYNWHAVGNNEGICPKDWNVPKNEDWVELIDFLGEDAAEKLKSTQYWESPYESIPEDPGTNESGFSALPGGERLNGGPFTYLEHLGFWWSSTEEDIYRAGNVMLSSIRTDVRTNDDNGKRWGNSVRCLKN